MAPEPQIKTYACPQCSWADFHPAETCPHCGTKTKESLLAGAGKVATFTVIRYPPKGFENESPYVVALVDIEKGPRTIGRVSTNQTELRIGQNVRFVREKNGALEFEVLT